MSINISLDNSDAASFLVSILGWLDHEEILYCVERNYQGYPDRLTGDVDLVVPDGQVAEIARGILDIANNSGWQCYQEHTWEKASYLGFEKAIYPGRFALTIELFAGAHWHGMAYLTSSIILKNRIRHGITWKPHPAHQVIITTIHHLLYNGTVPKKYREEVLLLLANNSDRFIDDLSPVFGHSLAKFALQSIVNSAWDELAKKVKKYRKVLLSASAKRPIESVPTMFRGFMAVRKIPEGIVLLVYGDDYKERETLCNLLLNVADCWHIFNPPLRKIIHCDPLNAQFAKSDFKSACHVLHRGGVVIFGCSNVSDIKLTLFYPEYKIYCSEKYEIKVKGESIIKDFDEDKFISYSNEQKALRMWNFILADRAKRKI